MLFHTQGRKQSGEHGQFQFIVPGDFNADPVVTWE